MIGSTPHIVTQKRTGEGSWKGTQTNKEKGAEPAARHPSKKDHHSINQGLQFQR